MGIEAKKIILMSQEFFLIRQRAMAGKSIIPLFHSSIFPTGLPNGGQVPKWS